MLINGNHRAQAQFDRAKWRPMVMIPTWVLQLGLSMSMMGLFAYRLGDSMKVNKDNDKKNDDPTIEIV
jgi:thiol:disulfide interchange protein